MLWTDPIFAPTEPEENHLDHQQEPQKFPSQQKDHQVKQIFQVERRTERPTRCQGSRNRGHVEGNHQIKRHEHRKTNRQQEPYGLFERPRLMSARPKPSLHNDPTHHRQGSGVENIQQAHQNRREGQRAQPAPSPRSRNRQGAHTRNGESDAANHETVIACLPQVQLKRR